MREPAGHGVPHPALAATLTAPLVVTVRVGDDIAGQYRPARFDTLPRHDQTQAVQASEGRQIRGSEGSVSHVEVLQMGGVGTSITRETSTPTPTQPASEPINRLHPQMLRAGLRPKPGHL